MFTSVPTAIMLNMLVPFLFMGSLLQAVTESLSFNSAVFTAGRLKFIISVY